MVKKLNGKGSFCVFLAHLLFLFLLILQYGGRQATKEKRTLPHESQPTPAHPSCRTSFMKAIRKKQDSAKVRRPSGEWTPAKGVAVMGCPCGRKQKNLSVLKHFLCFPSCGGVVHACDAEGSRFEICIIVIGKRLKTALRWEAGSGFNEAALQLAQAAAMKDKAARQQRTLRPLSARKEEGPDAHRSKQQHQPQNPSPSVYFARTNPTSAPPPPPAGGAIGLTLIGLRNKYNRLPAFTSTSWPEFLVFEHKILLSMGCYVSAAAVFQVGRQVCCEGPRVVCFDSDDEEMEEQEQEQEKRAARASKAPLPQPESQAESVPQRQTKRKATLISAPPPKQGAKRTPREYFLAQQGGRMLSVSLQRERPVRKNAQVFWNLSRRSGGRPSVTWLEILQELHETAESTDEAEVLQYLACRALNGNDSEESVPEP
jgi:hypothetical protein